MANGVGHSRDVAVIIPAAGMGSDEVRVMRGDLRPAMTKPFASRIVDQPTGAIVLEHQSVAVDDGLARGLLRIVELVFDDLERHRVPKPIAEHIYQH